MRQEEENPSDDNVEEAKLPAPHPFTIVFEELSSDDEADSNCDFDLEIQPPTPQKFKSILMRQIEKTKVEAPVIDDNDGSFHSGTSSGKGEDKDTSAKGSEEDQSRQDYEESSESSNSAEKSETFNTWAEYYKEGKGKDEMETLLIKYCHHIQDNLCGCKKPTHAIWHSQNVRRISDTMEQPNAIQ